eukprot:m.345716 g.345716  ORF g.345716 m.345716 type:complete len:206 (+) comp27064_c0_seq1:122-739(+)
MISMVKRNRQGPLLFFPLLIMTITMDPFQRPKQDKSTKRKQRPRSAPSRVQHNDDFEGIAQRIEEFREEIEKLRKENEKLRRDIDELREYIEVLGKERVELFEYIMDLKKEIDEDKNQMTRHNTMGRLIGIGNQSTANEQLIAAKYQQIVANKNIIEKQRHHQGKTDNFEESFSCRCFKSIGESSQLYCIICCFSFPKHKIRVPK